MSVAALLLSLLIPHAGGAVSSSNNHMPDVVTRVVAPYVGTVVQRFVAPSCDRCAGHRGVTVSTTAGDHVMAVGPGEITFAGSVGGTVFVVQQIRPGVRVTYGWLASVAPEVRPGVRVSGGQVLGTVGERSYLGVRVGSRYVEPLSLLGLWQARLVGPGGVHVGRRAVPR